MLYPALLLLLHLASTVQGGGKVVVNWGQNPTQTEQRLGHYCDNKYIDIINLTFLNKFSGAAPSEVNLAGHCYEKVCPKLGGDVAYCQSRGKKVLLSLGGALGEYGLDSTDAARDLAQQMYNEYFEGDSGNPGRRFGSVKLDGIDLHLLNKKPENYHLFVAELKRLQPSLIISATPQCVFRDANLHSTMDSVPMDHVNVMFYNNPDCGIKDTGFNFDAWRGWAQTTNTKIMVGVLASPRIPSYGFVAAGELQSKLDKIKNDPQFGGLMIWDATYGFDKVAAEDPPFGEVMAQYIHQGEHIEDIPSTLEDNGPNSHKDQAVKTDPGSSGAFKLQSGITAVALLLHCVLNGSLLL